MSKFFAATLAIAATIGTFAMSGAAHAAAADEAIGVRFADLDLTSQAGQRTLDRRIDKAARQVCGIDDVVTGTRVRSREAQTCFDQAVRSTRASVARAIEGSRTNG